MGNAHSDPSLNPDGDHIPHNKTYFIPIFGHPAHSRALAANSSLQVTDNNIFGSFVLTPLFQPISNNISNCELLDRFGILPTPGHPEHNAAAFPQSKPLCYDNWGCGQKYSSTDKIPDLDRTPFGTPYYHNDYLTITTSSPGTRVNPGLKLPSHFQPLVAKYVSISPQQYDGVCVVPEPPSKSNPSSAEVSRLDSTELSTPRSSMISMRMSTVGSPSFFSTTSQGSSHLGSALLPTFPIPFLKLALNQSQNVQALGSPSPSPSPLPPPVEAFPVDWMQLPNVSCLGSKVFATVTSFRSRLLPLHGLHPSKPPLPLDFNLKSPNGPWVPDEPSTVGSKGQPLWAPNGFKTDSNSKTFFTQLHKKQLACPPPVMFSTVPLMEYDFGPIAQLQHTIHQPAVHVGTILILDFFSELASLTLSTFIRTTSALLVQGCQFALIDVPVYIILLQDPTKLHLDHQRLTKTDIVEELTKLGFGSNNLHFFSPTPTQTLDITKPFDQASAGAVSSPILGSKALLDWKDHNELSNDVWHHSILPTHFALHKQGAFRSFFNTTSHYRVYNLVFPQRWPAYYKGDAEWSKALWNVIFSQKVKVLDFDPPTWSKVPGPGLSSPSSALSPSSQQYQSPFQQSSPIRIHNSIGFSKLFQQMVFGTKYHVSDPIYHPILIYFRAIQHYFFAMRCAVDASIHPITTIHRETSSPSALVVAAAATAAAASPSASSSIPQLTASSIYPAPQPTSLGTLFSSFNQLMWSGADTGFCMMVPDSSSEPSVTPKGSVSLQQRPQLTQTFSATPTIAITTSTTYLTSTAQPCAQAQALLNHSAPFVANPIPERIVGNHFDPQAHNSGIPLPLEFTSPYLCRSDDPASVQPTPIAQLESKSPDCVLNGSALGPARLMEIGEMADQYQFEAFVLFSDRTLISDHDNTMPLSAYRFSSPSTSSTPINRFSSQANLKLEQAVEPNDLTPLNTSQPPRTTLALYLSKTSPHYPPQIQPQSQTPSNRQTPIALYSTANHYGGGIADLHQLNMEVVLKKYMSFYFNSYRNLDDPTHYEKYSPQPREFPLPPQYLLVANGADGKDAATVRSLTAYHAVVRHRIDLNELSAANKIASQAKTAITKLATTKGRISIHHGPDSDSYYDSVTPDQQPLHPHHSHHSHQSNRLSIDPPLSPTTTIPAFPHSTSHTSHTSEDQSPQSSPDMVDITITYTTRPTDDGVIHANGLETAQALMPPSPSSFAFAPLRYLFGAVVIPFSYTRALSLLNTDLDLQQNPPRNRYVGPRNDTGAQIPHHTAVNEQDREQDEEKGIFYYPSFTKPPIPSLMKGYYDSQTQPGAKPPALEGMDTYPNGNAAPSFPPQSVMSLFHSHALVEPELLNPFKTTPTRSLSSRSSHSNRIPIINLPNITKLDCQITFIVACSNDVVDDDDYELAYFNFVTKRRHLAHQRKLMKKQPPQDSHHRGQVAPQLPSLGPWERTVDEVREPIKRSHFEWFSQVIPQIYKFELIYRYFFPTSIPDFQRLEQLWDVRFVHSDDIPMCIKAVERRAIHTRMELYKASVNNYHHNAIHTNPYTNMNAIQE